VNDLQKRTAKAIVNIFETGRVAGDYGAVTVLKGDQGHLTYGRSQTTLGSGNLFLLLKAYCERPDAQFASGLSPFLPDLANREVKLDRNIELRELLKDAGDDPAMRDEQDRFFDAHYFDPAGRTAQARGILSPLGQTVVYDSFVQGGFKTVTALVGASVGTGGIDERQWVQRYINARKNWLLSLAPPLPKTVYRMDCFTTLVSQGAWDLSLNLTVRGALISPETLGDAAAVVRAAAVDPSDPPPPPVLYLKTPYMRDPEVRKVQEALNTNGFPNNRDGVYGPFTAELVKQFQKAKQLRDDGVVGPATRVALGL